jgi:hypothetical protein
MWGISSCSGVPVIPARRGGGGGGVFAGATRPGIRGPLDPSTEEYQIVAGRAVESSLPYEDLTSLRVLSITRVGDTLPNSELQFHGTPEVHIDQIRLEGFSLGGPGGAGGALGSPALYFSRSAKTAFWHAKPRFIVDQTTGERRAEGKLLLCSVQVGNTKSVTEHNPHLTLASVRSEGFDSTTIRAAELWPSSLIGDETAVYEANRARAMYVLDVAVKFGDAGKNEERMPRFMEWQTAAKITQLRKQLCNPEVQSAWFEGSDEDFAVGLFEALKARGAVMDSLYFSTGETTFHHRGLLAAAEALRSNVTLCRLQISLSWKDEVSVCDGDWAMTQLCRGLETNTHLTVLSFCGFIPRLEADGCTPSPGTIAFCQMLSCNTTLRTVHLHAGGTSSGAYAYSPPPSRKAVAIVKAAHHYHRPGAPLKVVYGGRGLGAGNELCDRWGWSISQLHLWK